MTPVEDDTTIWEAIMRFIKSSFGWFGSFSGLAIPAFAGAIIGTLRQDRRKRVKKKIVPSIVISAVSGCGLAPLFAHLFGIPDSAASSLAFFLGIWGLEGIEVAQHVLRSKAGQSTGKKQQ